MGLSTSFPKTQHVLSTYANHPLAIMREDYEKEPSFACFTLLLASVANCRKATGVKKQLPFDELKLLSSAEQKEVRAYLKRVYGIVDGNSLDASIKKFYNMHQKYMYFLAYQKHPELFQEHKIDKGHRKTVKRQLAYASLFYPYVNEKGFYAFDCNESIGLYRLAYACALIDEDTFWQKCLPYAKQAMVLYQNWEEYAISLLCGAMYFQYCSSGSESHVRQTYELMRTLLEQLALCKGVYGIYDWFYQEVKKVLIKPEDLVQFVFDEDGSDGCIASDRIVCDGAEVGYMYRVKPSQSWDSGWRFLAGDEDQTYLNDAHHVGRYTLNTIANYDADILPFISDEVGSVYARKEDGLFHKIHQ